MTKQTIAQTATQTSAPQIPLRDFFRNPEQAAFALSDDGKVLGYLKPASVNGAQPRMNLFVQPLENGALSGQPKQLTHEHERDISGYFFKGNDVALYQKDFGGDENFHILSVNIHTGKVTDLTPFESVRASIEDDLPDDPNHVLISHNQRNAEVFDVYRINIHTGEAQRVAENPGNIVGWLTDHDGKVRAAITTGGLNTSVLFRQSEEQAFQPIITTDYRTSATPIFFDFDNHHLFLLSNRGRDKAAFVRIDPAQPDQEEILFSNDEVDLDAVSYSRKRKKLTAASWVTDKRHRHFFDAQSQQMYEKLQAHLAGYEVSVLSHDREEALFIVASHSDRTSGTRYLYDAQKNALLKLAEINPAIKPDDMAPMQSIEFQSRDGLTIHGYLTIPKGVPAKDLPVVVNPHGGPWARDVWGYNPEVQFLANRGYAVLQINFRGSTGYGRKFWEASFGQWGLAMQDDITDGVQWLIKQGMADPKRIAIYGASYGGYATLAGVTFTPDLYAAAVDYVGVSNLFTFMQTIPPYWKPMLTMMRDMVGDPEADKARLTATSPALHVQNIKTPLFIAQGARDPRVNKAESDQIVQALKERGVEVQYMVKENEGHGFHNDENKFEFYEAMEKFLATHLKK